MNAKLNSMMAKPRWFKRALSVLSAILYSGDVGSDFWVGIDLVLRCHFRFAASAFSWLTIPGFLYGWYSFFDDGVYNWCRFFKALVYPIWMVPHTIWTLTKSALDIKDDYKQLKAKG